jgi:hypothetical protein
MHSLRQCAPLWPIAELEIVLCLTNPMNDQVYGEVIPNDSVKFPIRD